MASPGPAAPVDIDLAPGQSGFDLEVVREAVARGGPAFLPRQRWFGDKARAIASTSLTNLAFGTLLTSEPIRLALAIVEVSFRDGGQERYFLPLGLLSGAESTVRTLAELRSHDSTAITRLEDALALPEFHAWLLNPVASPSIVTGASGTFTWRAGARIEAALGAAETTTSRVSQAEQSNSAVIYGHDLLAKVFRKLRPGLNPDIEIGRFLSEQTDFRQFPELLGDLSYTASDDRTYSVAMILPFVSNLGDAWDYVQARLGDLLLATAVDLDLVAPFRRLGRRTGQLHRALATPTLDPAFAAVAITSDDVRGWQTALSDALDRTLASLGEHLDVIPASWHPRLAGRSATSPSLRDRISGFGVLEGVSKIRVHGDYHLGQALVTPDEDFVILDFEGEPSRAMDERRAKTSPLKDVAGMLRSISYARAAALRARPDEIPAADAEPHLLAWEADARDAFLAGYREETADHGVSFLPADPMSFAAALAAWELDKAVYEINYELNNRPDWLPLPLGALLGAE